MWRAIICLSAALILGVPNLAAAQVIDDDRQNPNEYTDEDSQPLRMLSYFVAPVGFLLEWASRGLFITWRPIPSWRQP